MGRYATSIPLTPDEEAELFKRIAQHGDQKAKDCLLTAYIPWVHKVVTRNRHRFAITDASYDDYVQEGVLGLMDALRKYDPSIARFSTYSLLWILQHMRMKRIRDQELSGQRPNRSMQRAHIMRTQRLLLKQLGREATPEEIVVHTRLSIHIVMQELAFLRTQFTSVDASIGEGSVFADVVEDIGALSPESYVIAREEWQRVGAYVASLLALVRQKFTARNADIFLRRHGLAPYDTPQTLDEIHAAACVSRERVRQVVVKMWMILEKGNPHFTRKELERAKYSREHLPELFPE